MRVLVTGSRQWQEPLTVWQQLHALGIQAYGDYDGGYQLTVVHGDCPYGVDRMAQQWVQASTFDLWQPVIITEEPHPADWKSGRQAGMLRNQYMVDLGADLCLAFIRDSSRGASDCLSRALAAGIECKVFHEWSERSTDD